MISPGTFVRANDRSCSSAIVSIAIAPPVTTRATASRSSWRLRLALPTKCFRGFEARPGTVLGEVVSTAFGDAEPPVVAAIVDGRLRELTWPLLRDSEVTPLTTATSDGARIYRRSLAFLMLVESRVTRASEGGPQPRADVPVRRRKPMNEASARPVASGCGYSSRP